METRFTPKEKMQEAQREVAMRRRVYPGRVESGKLDPQVAARQIEIMIEISEEYKAKADQDNRGFFG